MSQTMIKINKQIYLKIKMKNIKNNSKYYKMSKYKLKIK